MKNKEFLESPRLLEKKIVKRKLIKLRIIIASLVFVFLFVVSAFLSNWSQLNIKNIEVNGNNVILKEEIESVVRENLSSKYFFIFPKTNFVLYPKNKIKKELFLKYKRLNHIEIKLKEIQTIEINLIEYDGTYIWCGEYLENYQNNLNQECFFIDKNGYVFDKAPYFSGEIYFRLYGKIDTREDVTGSFFFKEKFADLSLIKEMLERMDLKPVALNMKEDGDIEFYLSSLKENKPKIILKSDLDISKTMENLQSIILTDPLKKELKENYSNLLYIDLRFGNKIFYKFK